MASFILALVALTAFGGSSPARDPAIDDTDAKKPETEAATTAASTTPATVSGKVMEKYSIEGSVNIVTVDEKDNETGELNDKDARAFIDGPKNELVIRIIGENNHIVNVKVASMKLLGGVWSEQNNIITDAVWEFGQKYKMEAFFSKNPLEGACTINVESIYTDPEGKEGKVKKSDNPLIIETKNKQPGTFQIKCTHNINEAGKTTKNFYKKMYQKWIQMQSEHTFDDVVETAEELENDRLKTLKFIKENMKDVVRFVHAECVEVKDKSNCVEKKSSLVTDPESGKGQFCSVLDGKCKADSKKIEKHILPNQNLEKQVKNLSVSIKQKVDKMKRVWKQAIENYSLLIASDGDKKVNTVEIAAKWSSANHMVKKMLGSWVNDYDQLEKHTQTLEHKKLRLTQYLSTIHLQKIDSDKADPDYMQVIFGDARM